MSNPIARLGSEMPVALAPMAGITDLPFRNLVTRLGAGMVVSEMVASQELITNGRDARSRAELGAGLEATAVQIAGREAGPMAECARMVADLGARSIDINMGCPAKKVTNGWSGSALMRNLDHALGLIDAVVGAVDVPVTLKTRLGWDETSINAPELARRAEAAGVAMITIHGRTRCQFYRGQADWAAIAAVKAAVSVPLLANGDIVDASTARTALARSGADGVMIGRGIQGQPWLLSQVGAELAGQPVPDAPAGEALADLIGTHHEAMLSFYGRDLGIRNARKHLGWYLDRIGGGGARRPEIMRGTDPAAVMRAVRAAVRDAPLAGDLPQRTAA
ncbi:tRNA dihydrouridine synthase DusB [Oceanomicrobium pacificus]|uniref:tRNA-dihydrouridine synthase n=1 Tax=Oceanomicrobium pacificus TaxID=2692916 RepID=A0A6B0TPE4_9RHOB|nr:tRNA dihydrouridine synthase DusB [Oceanomicrobium pacificus]MXU65766.1 tRNA dihydrouridine synthase DusB [Oceanomicrobium pacificus]